jgi:hypothetical protein
MLAMIAVPAGITLLSVHVPAIPLIPGDNPTPYGYTWSLLLFIVPIVVIAFWFFPSQGVHIQKAAFWRTILTLVPIGFGLDFFFASRLFTFDNSHATLGISAPALHHPVPIEEYVFYFTGFVVVLLLYIWCDEYWLAAYNVPDYAGQSKPIRRLLTFHPESLIAGIALVVAAILYKRFRSQYPDGFPEYFTILVLGGLVPSIAFYPAVRRFINWRALSLTLFVILLISMFWEATLAVPYSWWNYQKPRMTGLFIGAWANLPIEAVTVWLAVTYGTIIIYEVVKIWQASGKSAKLAFLGMPSAKDQPHSNVP